MKKEQLTYIYKEFNNEITYVNKDIAWIINEFNGIYNEKTSILKKDTEWFINEWNDYLKSIVNEHKTMLLEDIFIEGIKIIKNKYYNQNKFISDMELPLASITLIRWNNNILEYFILGDNKLWINENNKVYTIEDNSSHEIKETLFKKLKRIKKINKNISFEELNTYIKPTLIQNKSKANIQNSYWTLSLNEDSINNSLHGTFYIKDNASLLLTNYGFTSIVDNYNFLLKKEVFEIVEKYKLQSILNMIWSIENNDSSGKKFPRLNKHNNFSAIYLNFK